MKLPGLVRWYGGKGQLMQQVLPWIPRTRVYVEPYGGAASILLNRKISAVEVYNDLDGRLVNLARVIQDARQYRRLRWRLEHTPYSFDEFKRALDLRNSADPVDAAWGFFVSQNQGFGGKADTSGNWGRVFVERRGVAMTVSTFRSRVRRLRHVRARMLAVQLDNRDALDVLRYWDSADTTFYLDPPYAAETRAKGHRNVYAHECEDGHHVALVGLLLTLKGCAVLSGYASDLYAPLAAAGWSRVDVHTACYAASRGRGGPIRGAGAAMKHAARTECLWLNPAAQAWHERQRQPLFAGAGDNP